MTAKVEYQEWPYKISHMLWENKGEPDRTWLRKYAAKPRFVEGKLIWLRHYYWRGDWFEPWHGWVNETEVLELPDVKETT